MKKDYLKRLFTFLALVGMPFALTYGQLEVTAPAGVAGTYNAGFAFFGPQAGGFSGELAVVTDTDGASTACVAVDNAVNDVTGKVALIDRGACAFVTKALNAQAAGAIGMVLCSIDAANPDNVVYMGGDDLCEVTIPVVSLSYNDCQALRVETGVTVSFSVSAGETVEDPISITDGTYTVAGITGNDGLFTGGGSIYYTYVPAADGILNVNSCGGGADTRVIIAEASGTCRTELVASLEPIDDSADDCDDGGGNIVASETNTPVYAGQTYYIIWDDAQSTDGFDFSVSLGALTSVDYTFNVNMAFETVSGPVQMVYAGPGATGLGDVTVVPMADGDGDGIWSATVTLTVLDTIGYAFVNGDVLAGGVVETVPGDCGLDGGFGFNVRPLIATSIDPVTLDAVCFSSCTGCEVTDCDDPFIFIDDDIEALTEGNANGQTAWWGAWPGTNVSGTVTTEQAFSGSKSIKIAGNIPGQDCLLNFGDKTEGHFLINWAMYVPEGNNAYFNLQHAAPTSSAGFWGLDCFFENGVGRLELYDGRDPVAFAFPSGAWFPVYIIVDLDNDNATMVANDKWVASWQFSTGSSAAASINQLNSINFYPLNSSNVYYVDNVNFWQIPAAGDGQYCYTATTIDAGTHSVTGLSCYGGYHDLAFFSDGSIGAQAAAWFAYTPAEDGVITITSCGGDADSRGWIFSGDCGNLKVIGVNDDRCLMSTGDDYASYREAVVTGGETYYIMWDDNWDRTDFDWELIFSSEAPVEAAFCQSAVAVEANVDIIVEEFVGEAAAAGLAIGASSVSTPVGYVGSNWYSYTPEEDGVIDITSCDSGTDTWVFVYTGTCDNFSTLELIASSDDDCGASSLVEGLEVTAGTTYYIEWIDRWSVDPFIWQINFTLPVATVTFQVDVQLLIQNGVFNDEVFLAGSFNGWSNLAMDDTDGDNIWTVEVTVPANAAYQYKFKNGPDGWEQIDGRPELGAPCTVGATGDRETMVGADDVVLETVCFGYCVNCEIVRTDVDEVQLQAGVKVFPNPVKDVLNVNIDLSEAAENLNIRMVNTLGQVVYERYLGSLQADNIEIDVTNIPAGAYMIQVADGKAQFTQSVVVQ